MSNLPYGTLKTTVARVSRETHGSSPALTERQDQSVEIVCPETLTLLLSIGGRILARSTDLERLFPLAQLETQRKARRLNLRPHWIFRGLAFGQVRG